MSGALGTDFVGYRPESLIKEVGENPPNDDDVEEAATLEAEISLYEVLNPHSLIEEFDHKL